MERCVGMSDELGLPVLPLFRREVVVEAINGIFPVYPRFLYFQINIEDLWSRLDGGETNLHIPFRICPS